MAETGIDISEETPKVLTDDPAGQGVEAVRPIRYRIKALVEELIAELAPQKNV
jgi:hypothetical protein